MLKSCSGCKKQYWHKDFAYDYVYNSQNMRYPNNLFLSMLVAIQDNTILHMRHKEDIHLSVGDYVVFGGRVVHAGAAYTKDHYRLFTYLKHDYSPHFDNMTELTEHLSETDEWDNK